MNHTSEYEFTIIVPVYNERDNIDRLEEAFAHYLPAASRRSCVLFINDGSTDGSLELLQRICARNPHFYYLSFVRNAGLFKRFQSKFANSFRRMMTHDGATDTGCPLKVMQTPAAKRLPLFKGMHRFLPALILLQEGASYA